MLLEGIWIALKEFIRFYILCLVYLLVFSYLLEVSCNWSSKVEFIQCKLEHRS